MRLIKPKVRFVHSAKEKMWDVTADGQMTSMTITEYEPQDKSRSPVYIITSNRGTHDDKTSLKAAMLYARKYFGG